MWLFRFLIDNLNTDEKVNLERYESSKKVFMLSWFIFSISFYAVWTWFNDSIFLLLFTYSYITALLAMSFFLYFSLKVKLIWYFSWMVFMAFFILFSIFPLLFLRFVS